MEKDLTHDEQVKIQNFTAQFNSIQTDLKVANSELEITLKKTEETKASHNEMVQQIADKNKIVEELALKAKSLDDLIKSRQEDFDQQAETIKAVEDQSLAISAADRRELAEEKARHTIEIENLTGELLKVTETLDSESAILRDLQTQESELKDEVDSLISQKISLTEEVTAITTKWIKEKRELEQTITSLQSELKDLEDKIAIAKDNISTPLQVLADREAEIEEKEKNLLIMKTRFEREFKKLYPDREVNI